MILTNISNSTLSFIGLSNIPYEIKPGAALTIPDRDVKDSMIENLVSKNLIQVTNWNKSISSVNFSSMISGERPLKDVLQVMESSPNYVVVPPGLSNVILSSLGSGAAGDTINRLIITISTPATSGVLLTDGSGSSLSSYQIYPNNMAVGCQVLGLGDLASTAGPWKLTTGAGVSVIAVGMFS